MSVDRAIRPITAGLLPFAAVALLAWVRNESSDSVIARADRALYDAERAGRDRACLSV